MVKADAYNHGVQGVVEISKNIVDRYGVATLGEAVTLRKMGVVSPICVFSSEVNDMPYAKEYDLTLVIHNLQGLNSLMKTKHTDYHIKIDSGMRRFGFSNRNDVLNAVKLIKEYGVKPRAIHTHFASSETIEEQVKAFDKLTKPIIDCFNPINLILSATSGIERGYLYDGVRAGLIAYRKSLKVCSRVLEIKSILPGEKVGYDGAFAPSYPTKIAIVSGGYYDGIRRSYKGAEVIVNGCIAHIVGKVSMDTTIVEIGDIPTSIGDEVIFINADTIDSYMEKGNTNEYEVLTSIKGRAQRIYYYNGKRSYQITD